MADPNFEVGPSCCDKIDKIRYSDKYLKKKRQYTLQSRNYLHQHTLCQLATKKSELWEIPVYFMLRNHKSISPSWRT